MKKMIAAMMILALTTTTATAATKRHHNDRTTVIVVNDRQAATHFDQLDRSTTRYTAHPRHARHDIKTCTFPVSRHAVRHNAVARAQRINGVKNAYYNPHTGEMTVTYDAYMTSAQHIIHTVK